MQDLKFDEKHFTETIMKEVQPILDEIQQNRENARTLYFRLTGLEMNVETEISQLSNYFLKDLQLVPSPDEFAKKAEAWGKAETKKRALETASEEMTAAFSMLDRQLEALQKQLCDKLHEAVRKYGQKARLPIAGVFDTMLKEDERYGNATRDIYYKVYAAAEIKQPPFARDLSCLDTYLMPRGFNKLQIRSAAEQIKKEA